MFASDFRLVTRSANSKSGQSEVSVESKTAPQMVSEDPGQGSGLRGFLTTLDRSWDSLLGEIRSDDVEV
jgi:hypothetical protein